MRGIIVIAGKNATGKTLLARQLKKILGAKIFHVRRFLRASAKRLKTTESDLYRRLLSESKIKPISIALDNFLKIHKSSYSFLIVEGVVSPEEIDFLKERFPNVPLWIIYVESPEWLRVKRIMNRHKFSAEQAKMHIKSSDSFRCNFGLEEIKKISDLILLNKAFEKNSFFEAFMDGFRKASVRKITGTLKRRLK